jgi:hypothetical protein
MAKTIVVLNRSPGEPEPHAEIMHILHEHYASMDPYKRAPLWLKVPRLILLWASILTWTFFYGTAALAWLHLIVLSRVTPSLKAFWVLSSFLGCVFYYAYAALGMAFDIVKRFSRGLWLHLSDECRMDCLLLERLARFDMFALTSVRSVTAMRSDIVLGREKLLLGPLSKIPLLIAMFVSVFALFSVEPLSLPNGIEWLAQILPKPLEAWWLGFAAMALSVFRALTFSLGERATSYSAYLTAAIELRCLPNTAVVTPSDSEARALRSQ